MKKRSMLVALAGAIVLASTVVLLVQTAGFHRVRLVGGNNLQVFPKEGLVVTFTGWDPKPAQTMPTSARLTRKPPS
jgi:hypothetical protein